MADTFETAKAAADAVRVTMPQTSQTSKPTSRRTTRPKWFQPRSQCAENSLAKQTRRRRGRLRNRAAQDRPNLCHAGRDAQPSRAARHDRDLGRLDVDAVRGVARSLQPPGRARADVRPAERERPRHHQVRWLGFRQQAVSMDAMPARRGGAAVGQAGETRGQPQDDVPVGRSSRAHPAARAAGRHARRQARLAPARLRLPPVDARRPRRLRRGHAVPIQRAQPPRDVRTRQAQRRRNDRHARPRPDVPGSTPPSRR